MTTIDGLPLRALRPEDADEVIALISATYAEYPGCVLDLPGVDADLPELADRLQDAGGRGWVVTDAGRVVACVGVVPLPRADGPGTEGPRAELKRLYVAATHRRRGIGRALVRQVEEHAATTWGTRIVELWSDDRFEDAHRLYVRCGYAPTGATRELHDPSDTTELAFERRLPS